MVLLYPIRDTISRIIFHSASYLVLVSHQARFPYSYITSHSVLVSHQVCFLVFLYRNTLGTRSHQVCFLYFHTITHVFLNSCLCIFKKIRLFGKPV
ncbi:hypothetical protein HanXRQr2_Chr17g0815451 [Helianthus annuus]|uniref:Uncharacterized protein n=1 Tax=Helianthus annuus TaxID=4232 RepID=A0A9K3DJ89_HELAN|nr:hypothetical protein HanXRQr2_Chr17g0815451 [Helianthus annuus]